MRSRRGSRASPTSSAIPRARVVSTSRTTSATSRICGHSTPGTGSRSTRSSSGWSRSSARTGCGSGRCSRDSRSTPAAAASRTTISCAVRPGRERSSTVSIHSGRFSGARFWKKNSPSTPWTYRFNAIGRPRRAARRRRRRRSSGRGRAWCGRPSGSRPSGLVIVTSRPATSRTLPSCHGDTIGGRGGRARPGVATRYPVAVDFYRTEGGKPYDWGSDDGMLSVENLEGRSLDGGPARHDFGLRLSPEDAG